MRLTAGSAGGMEDGRQCGLRLPGAQYSPGGLRAVSIMRRFVHLEGQQDAVQINLDLIVRHKGTVQGFFLISLQSCKEDHKMVHLPLRRLLPKLCSGDDGHGSPTTAMRRR